ncbi:mRNA capping enzyme alpha subunit-like protein [Podospora australis]|uniref:mRNA-capping enzyme subunit alpha n=1 Tax=Podospora australis TaxID=1536484 RepID=A0AAN7AJ89_9PEZI|nr:mRNA capping enzyme alpha subunit-like protein [Podospora australis]
MRNYSLLEDVPLSSSSEEEDENDVESVGTDASWVDVDRYDAPPTPSSTGDEAPRQQTHESTDEHTDDEDDDIRDQGELVPRRKPGGYDSRVEQMLYEDPDLPILIVDAGKSSESGRYIVYTIKTGELIVRRRYSEFASLREALTRLHPTLIIPPIPEKHTVADYAANPTNAKQDQQIIDLRKRMLAVFLNRCRRMEQVRTDGVWWRFLDPNSSWNEVMNSHPVSSIPKSIMRAPPLDPANPTPGHNHLPIPATSAKLKSGPPSTPTTEPGAVFARFPPDSGNLSEQELDPYFTGYEASAKDLEALLTGPMEKVNRRTLSHLSNLAMDLQELGARYNAFALSDPNSPLELSIERIGQAADSSYIATEELSSSLGASFAEPMRENAQFAGVIRNVLRYRVLKRVQQEMTTEELNKKRALLDQLERSEAEARRIDQYLSSSQQLPPPPKRSTSSRDYQSQHRRDGSNDETASIDSDFPPTHGDFSSAPSAKIGTPERSAPAPSHKKAPSSSISITNKIFGPLRHAVQGVVDADPEKTRRDMITKTRESIQQLEQAQVAAAQDVKDASASVMKDLQRFQKEKEEDLKRYMLAYAKSQIEWAKKNRETWAEAKVEVEKIDDFVVLLALISPRHRQLIMDTESRPLDDIAEPGIRADPELVRRLRAEVARLLGRNSHGFPGAQPVSFGRRHIEELKRKDYFVCEKSDGIRYLLYLTVDEFGKECHYLIDRKNDYWFIHRYNLHFPLQSDPLGFHVDTLIDGELVMDRVPGAPDGRFEPKFLVFDLLVLDGKNDILSRSLDKRLAHFKDFIMKPYEKLFAEYPDELKYQAFKVEMKDMQYSYGIEMMFRQILPNLKHDNDGLIFTCRTTPYQFGTDQHILKWKAPHDNTVDFRLRLNFPTVQEEEGGEQFVDYDSVPEAQMLVFTGSDRGQPNYQLFNERLYLTEEEWEQLKQWGDPLQDRVIECCLDGEKRWRLYRFRDDKSEANHSSTVNSVLESIKDGVTELELIDAAKGIRHGWKARAASQGGH